MATSVIETPITREQLRTFHIAAHGLDQFIPSSPLRPAVLDQLQQLPPSECGDLVSLYSAAVASSRGKARTAFLARLKHARGRLNELLTLDATHSPEASSPENISAALGREAGLFFNSSALAEAFHADGLARIDSERRTRIETTIATLDSAIEDAEKHPVFLPFDNSQTALEFCERQLDHFSVVLRALKTARLESESAFDPAVHIEALDRFDWQAADAAELLALPPVLVLETAERLAQSSLTSFGRILRSGRPIQILVTSSGLYADDLSGFIPDFGYLAIAHREAFVLQSSLSRPDHLTAGLAEMAATLRPAAAIVSAPAAPDHDARLASSLLYLSHAFPLYRYDPDRGETWSERFALLVDEELHVTAADAAAASQNFRGHFRIIPTAAWNDEQMELSEYLSRYSTEPPLAIPFIWVTGDDGAPQRAILTRELVNLCRDRTRAWRLFEDLGTVKKPDTAQAKIEGATEAIHRVLALLTTPPVEQVSRPVLPEPLQTPPPETGLETCSTADPYIDSFLCTSCNDCFKINPRLFAYDTNKQAFIADPAAGTFAELVKAAEACPARCIHPGTPRPGDPTATPQLVAKAAKLT